MTLHSSLLNPKFGLIAPNIFDDMLFSKPVNHSNTPVPTNQFIQDGNLVIEFALAGYTKDQINVSVDGARLLVKVEAYDDRDDIEFIHHGIKECGLEMAFKGPDKYNLNKLKVVFIDGILRIIIPPTKDMEPKTFEIK
jgi:HSP20 family molecular chaperone IbpA